MTVKDQTPVVIIKPDSPHQGKTGKVIKVSEVTFVTYLVETDGDGKHLWFVGHDIRTLTLQEKSQRNLRAVLDEIDKLGKCEVIFDEIDCNLRTIYDEIQSRATGCGKLGKIELPWIFDEDERGDDLGLEGLAKILDEIDHES